MFVLIDDIDEEMDIQEESMQSESSLSFSGVDSQRVIISESSKLRQEVSSVIQAYCYTSEESLTLQQNSCLMKSLEILSYSTDYRDECNFKIVSN
ncbi:unnamed protein product, partial [Timema podura]|nr:unnamed protein product [Timema podura]